VYRSPSAVVGLIASAIVAAFLLGDVLIRAGFGTTLLIAPWVLLLLWAVYVAAFASVVVTDDDGITVQNFLRRTRVPWGQVTDIALRYQLVVTTRDGRRVTAFGGPVSGRAWRRSGDADGRRMPTALRDTDSIRDRWEAADVTPDGGRVVRSWDIPALVVLVILVAGAVTASLIVAGSTSA
jgi:hypothetical protein